MRQGIIFGLIVIVLGYFGVTVANSYLIYDSAIKIVNIVAEGEEIYSSPLDNYEEKTVWIIEEDDGTELILTDDEITDYYDLELTQSELHNPDLIDFDVIIEKSGENTEINMLLFNEGTITMYEANCPNKVCVKTGAISEVNQQIVCIPHKLVVKIVGDSNVDA